jgi:hypothetical protein
LVQLFVGELCFLNDLIQQHPIQNRYSLLAIKPKILTIDTALPKTAVEKILKQNSSNSMSADNPPPPEVTGDFYLTPALQKRPDGLCPQLLSDGYTSCMSDDNGGVWFSRITGIYRTNSRYLNSVVRQLNDDSLELEFISGSITEFLRQLGMKDRNISGMEFFARGCTWTLDLNPAIGTPNYQIHVSCFARREESDGTTTFIVATSLFDKEERSLASSSLPGFKEAKETFEHAALAVRKAVVMCEFPQFPEGLRVIPSTGEAKGFKEVYKLKAMVRNSVRK